VAERPPEIVLVRHGETEWSRSGRHTGRTDIPLTPAGWRQAELLAVLLEGRSLTRVLTSPLGRALETCCRAGLGGSAEIRDDLMVGLRRLRGTDDRRDPGRASQMVVVARRCSGRGDRPLRGPPG
jgi:hypothetical protein